MAQVTMTSVDGILKEVYEDGGLNDQLNNDIKGLRRIERTSDGVTHEVGGKYVAFPLRVQRNHGVGARNEGEALPIPRTQRYVQARVKLAYLYGSLELTGQVFELAEKDFQAFASALDEEVSGLQNTLSKDTNRQVYGTSKGVMSTATAVGTTTTFVTTDYKFLEQGMFVDVFTSADAVRVADATITDVVVAAGVATVTFSPAAGAATAIGDYITRDNNVNKEMTGFGNIVAATGLLHNVDPATERVWASVVNGNAGTNRPVSEGLMIGTVDDIKTKGGGTPTVIFSNLGVRRAYFNLLVQQRRFTNTQKFDGGFTGLAFTTEDGDIPFVTDIDAPNNQQIYVNEKQIKLYETGDWSWMNRDGSRWQRTITSAGMFDAYSATLFKYAQIGTHRRNSHGRLTDLTEA